MTNLVIFNNKYVVSSSVFKLDKDSEFQFQAADLITPYGFFIPIGQGGGSLLRALQSEFFNNSYGSVNPTLLPPHGTRMRGVLVGMKLEYVSFFPCTNSTTRSTLVCSALPDLSSGWKVIETGQHHHDIALALVIKNCKTPRSAVQRLNSFTSGKIIDPLIINVKKLQEQSFAKKWLNLKSDMIDHTVKIKED